MRYPSGHKQDVREQILRETIAVIRSDGIQTITLAPLMRRLGLTHGGFYNHFQSKDDLLDGAVSVMFADVLSPLEAALEGRSPAEGLRAWIDFYLSPAHRDAVRSGCPLAVLSGVAPYLSPPSRKAVSEGRAAVAGRVAQALRAAGAQTPADEASSWLAELVGALTLARADPDRARSAAILRRSRDRLRRRLDGIEARAT